MGEIMSIIFFCLASFFFGVAFGASKTYKKNR